MLCADWADVSKTDLAWQIKIIKIPIGAASYEQICK